MQFSTSYQLNPRAISENKPSNILLEQGGFSNTGHTEKWDFTRNEWELKYTPSETTSYNIEKAIDISGIVDLWQE